MAVRPTKYPKWATMDVIDPVTGVNNVGEPTDEKKPLGYFPQEPVSRQWLNWLFRTVNQWIEYLDERAGLVRTANGNGVGVAPVEQSIVTLYAVDKSDPTHFIHAVGFKGTSLGFATADLTVIASDTLALGTVTGSNIPITGGTAANVVLIVTQGTV